MAESLRPYMGGQTTILSLNWTLAEADNDVASVRYQGQIQEQGAAPEALDEVWHYVRVANEWLLAGIEQV